MSSNLERELPATFLRKCVVLQLRTPRDREQLIEWLLASGKTHFPAISEEILMRTAQLVAEERSKSEKEGLYVVPSKSEYLDLLRAVITAGSDIEKQMALLDITARYTVRKKVSAE